MNSHAPFQPEDLDALDALLSRAGAVVPMSDIADGNHDERVIGMRHDVDNDILPAIDMACWEQERGYHSTYFILHTAPYWQDKKLLVTSLMTLQGLGHEIGFHLNAITESLETGEDPIDIAKDAVDELRGYDCDVRGVVAHGDNACYQYRFINDEIFTESARPEYGEPDRVISGMTKLNPISRSELGFDYDPNWLPRGEYISDSGGDWTQPFDDLADRFGAFGQLHMLVHPDWWKEAFVRVEAAA